MGKCNIPDTNPLDKECSVENNPVVTNSSCVKSGTGGACPVVDNCAPWELTKETDDSCFISAISQELLNISGADINVYRLLGIHEQGKLLDVTGNGMGISNGDMPNYPANNAFDKFITEWRSRQLGSDIVRSSYIGYDFGQIKLPNGRDRYGIETFVKSDVATIKLKQGCNPQNRVTKIRVERSSDGVKWYGVKMLDVPDCDGMVTLNFAKTVPSRFWRIRPVTFNGSSTDWWSVQALQLMDYEVTAVDNIQDRVFLENRDRDYDTSTVKIKGSYTPLELQSFQSRFGNSQIFGGGETYSIEINFSQVVALLGRPLVIGDIIQLPSETQYSPSLKPILKYLEVTNIAWSVNGYTLNWVPTLQRVLAEPVIASQETQDIFGKLTEGIDSTGLVDIDDGSTDKLYQDTSNIDQTITALADNLVPENGEDYAGVQKITKDDPWLATHPTFDVRKMDRNRNLYGIDAMPPNGLPFTEGDDFPANPKDKDWHRLTFTHVNNNIPPRLHRFSKVKDRWIYLETDRRFAIKNSKPLLQEFLNPSESSLTNPADTNKVF
ncbi:MAG: hypothetical protein JWP44_4096 [Mucilaginibacter sp.]|nr:hypothetical protein [Mucilaginibacter sp.]